jgi:hypothetical protein
MRLSEICAVRPLSEMLRLASFVGRINGLVSVLSSTVDTVLSLPGGIGEAMRPLADDLANLDAPPSDVLERFVNIYAFNRVVNRLLQRAIEIVAELAAGRPTDRVLAGVRGELYRYVHDAITLETTLTGTDIKEV